MHGVSSSSLQWPGHIAGARQSAASVTVCNAGLATMMEEVRGRVVVRLVAEGDLISAQWSSRAVASNLSGDVGGARDKESKHSGTRLGRNEAVDGPGVVDVPSRLLWHSTRNRPGKGGDLLAADREGDRAVRCAHVEHA